MKRTILATSLAAAFAIAPAFGDETLTLSGVKPTIKFTADPAVNSLLMGGRIEYGEASGSAYFQSVLPLENSIWTWVKSWTDVNQQTVTRTPMQLDQDHLLSLQPSAGGTASIILNPNNGGSITIGGSLTVGGNPVMTQSASVSSPNTNRFAMGPSSSVNADYSFAFGEHTATLGAGSVALGRYSEAQTANSFAFGNRAYAVGEGAVAMGTSIMNSNGSIQQPLFASGTGAATFGWGSSALGIGATAFGEWSRAHADHAVVGGKWNTVWGLRGVAFGAHSTIHPGATDSFTLGFVNQVYSPNSFAAGVFNTANVGSEQAFVFGHGNIANAQRSITFGYYNTTNGWVSNAIGWMNTTTSAAFGATAMGVGTKATAATELVVGSYNDPGLTPANSAHRQNDTTAAFTIGNGYETNSSGTPLADNVHASIENLLPANIVRGNAFIVRRNGKVESAGNVESNATTGYNKFKAPILVPESGDISMGDFTDGVQP